MLKSIRYLEETVELLRADVRAHRAEMQSHHKTMATMHDALRELDAHMLPMLLSFKLCRAVEKEICPLAMEVH